MTGRRGGEVISSLGNTRVKEAAALARRKERDAAGRYLVEGPRAVADVLSTGDVIEVLATEDEVGALAAAAAATDTPLTTVTDEVIGRVATTRTPQGVVAVVRQRHADLDGVVGAGHLIVLDGVSDPGNAGTVVRTATASGAAGVVLTSGSVDPWNPKAVRASAGTVATLPLVVAVTVEEVLRACAAAGQRTVALDVAGEVRATAHRVLVPPVALLFGNEAHGLSDEALGSCDVRASIPLYGPVDSLNLAAAVAVVAYAAAAETPA